METYSSPSGPDQKSSSPCSPIKNSSSSEEESDNTHSSPVKVSLDTPPSISEKSTGISGEPLVVAQYEDSSPLHGKEKELNSSVNFKENGSSANRTGEAGQVTLLPFRSHCVPLTTGSGSSASATESPQPCRRTSFPTFLLSSSAVPLSPFQKKILGVSRNHFETFLK